MLNRQLEKHHLYIFTCSLSSYNLLLLLFHGFSEKPHFNQKSFLHLQVFSVLLSAKKKNKKKKNKKKQNQKYGFRSVRGLMKLETQIPGSSRGYVILTLYWVFDIVIFGVVM